MAVDSTLSKTCEGDKIFCHTGMSVKFYSTEWEVENFLFIKPEDGWIDSPEFFTGTHRKLKWKMQIHSNSSGIKINLIPIFIGQTRLKYSFSVLDNRKNKFITNSPGEVVEIGCPTTEPQKALFIIYRKDLLKQKEILLPNGCLTFLCELEVAEKFFQSVNYLHDSLDLIALSDDLMRICQKSNLSDVTILVGNKKMSAHKAILAARSPVFTAMFDHDMRENNTSCINITDTTPKVMKEMLRYMYSGRVYGLETMAAELFIVADKYDVRSLKYACEETLISQLSSDNAIKILELASIHNSEIMKMKILKYMCHHRDEVLSTRSWKKLMYSNPALAVEVYSAIYEGKVVLKNKDYLDSHPLKMPIEYSAWYKGAGVVVLLTIPLVIVFSWFHSPKPKIVGSIR